MSAAHTPGPWLLDAPGTKHVTGNGDDYHVIETEQRGMDLLHIAGFIRSPDARLIAAAPDLLAALQVVLPFAVHELVNMLDNSDKAEVQQRVEAARAAIAKATGQGVQS